MSAQPQLDTPITPTAYLAFEREQIQQKHEFVDGIIYAMSGASRHHVRITCNLISSLNVQFKQRECSVYANDLRIKVNKTDYVYPDVVAICGVEQFEDEQFDTLLNPNVIIEVLSKSTQNYDRNRKMMLYQNISTVQDYVLIAQDEYRVEHYQRKTQNQWLLTLLTDFKQVLQLNSVNAEILLIDIYDKIVFNDKLVS